MLGGQNKKPPLGYTIIEVIIVLAISGIMFLIAANFINGKQEHTAFVQGTNDMVDQLQNVVDDVTDGHYSDVPLSCPNVNAPINVSESIGAGTQGGNQNCVFLGKMFNFYGASQPTRYQLFSLAALRSFTTASGGIPAGGDAAISAIPGLTTTGTIPQSLAIQKMSVITSAGATAASYSIGFTQGLGATTAVNGATVYQSGTQQVSLVYDSRLTNPGSNADYIQPNQENASTSLVNGTPIEPAKSAIICLTDGTRYAQIYIGGTVTGASGTNNNQLSISSQQLGTTRCP